jgi:hypothetical protein
MAPRWLLAILVLLALQVSADWQSTPDTVRYLSIARHIAAGEGIADLDNTAPYFPPGYPLLISVPFLLSERPFLAISLVHVLLIAVFAFAIWSWAQRRLGSGAALVTALVLVNASLWHHYRRPLSELAFATFAMVAVEVLHAIRAGPPTGRRQVLRLAAGVAAVAFLPLVREVGVVFAVGFGALSLADAWRGRLPVSTPPRVVCAVVLAGLLSTGAFVAYDAWAAHRAPAHHATHLASLIEPPVPHARWIRKAVRFRVGEIGRLVLPGGLHQSPIRRWSDPRVAVFLPLTLVVLYGWWRLLGRGDLLAATAPFYVGIYLVWGFEAGTRYMLPLLPLLVGALWIALERLGRARAWLFAALVAAHLAVSLYDWRTFDVPRARRCAAEWPTVEALARALPPGAAVSVAGEVPECVWSMLAFVLDRNVARDAGPWPTDASTEWRLEQAATPPGAGVTAGPAIGPYRLLKAG